MTLLLSALIGLMLVSFATVAPVNATSSGHFSHVIKNSSPFGGGYDTISSGEVTHATAEWNQPMVTCPPSLVGAIMFTGMIISNSSQYYGIGTLGGIGTPSGCAGSFASYSAGSSYGMLSGGTPTTTHMTALAITVNPGDAFSASFSFSPSTLILTANLTDLTTGQSASVAFAQAFSNGIPTGVAWAITAGFTGLPQFSVPIKFSNCTVTVSGQTLTISQIATVTRLTLVDNAGNMLARTSSLAKAGSSFRETWVSPT